MKKLIISALCLITMHDSVCVYPYLEPFTPVENIARAAQDLEKKYKLNELKDAIVTMQEKYNSQLLQAFAKMNLGDLREYGMNQLNNVEVQYLINQHLLKTPSKFKGLREPSKATFKLPDNFLQNEPIHIKK